MCREALSILVLVLVGACGPSQPPATARPRVESSQAQSQTQTKPAEPAKPVRYKITVVAASVDPKTADGKGWDEGPAPKAKVASLSGPLAAYLHGHGELEGAEAQVGEPVLAPGVHEDAKKGDAPDPMAFVQIGDAVFRTPLVARSFQPAWNYTFTIELRPDATDLVTITVVDWDGPEQLDPIGLVIRPARELLAESHVDLPRFGNVAKLTLMVEPVTLPATEKRLAVPGKPTWTDTGIDVYAGQRVAIDASGQVCTNGKSACDYPDGQPQPSEYNVPGFDKRGHGALVGALGDTRFFVGRERTFVAPSSGRLLLGVNDKDAGNNTGAMDVRVRLGE